MTAPATNDPGAPGNAKEIEIGLMHVRATDGLRVSYDLERNGWVIKQQRPHDDYRDEDGEWVETACLESWALDPSAQRPTP